MVAGKGIRNKPVVITAIFFFARPMGAGNAPAFIKKLARQGHGTVAKTKAKQMG